ncbi:MAG: hypothetical protein RLP09_00870 [Sandaracinaceae bacterium]
MRRLTALLLLAYAACGNPNPATSPATFDRPESVAFLCWRLDRDPDSVLKGEPVSLDRCQRTPTSVEDDTGEVDDGFALFALVTQTATGEVAAVRLTNDPEGQEDRELAGPIDADERIPGFTFIPVGEVPSSVVVRENDPKRAYVLNRGSSSISVIDLSVIRKGTGSLPETVMLEQDSRPSAMILTPSEDALLVALPGLGQIARIPLDEDGNLGEVTYVDLSTDVPPPVDLSTVPADALPPQYAFTCPATTLIRPPITAPREPVVPVDPLPEPWSFLVDPETGQVLISDLRYPIIRRIDPETLVESTPLSVSVPTRALALTPFVPATVDATESTERYLYAIDATDRSVLAIDVSDEARPTFGAVLPVSVGGQTDRLELPREARGLAVATPRYDAADPTAPRCEGLTDEAEQAGPASFYGVFLAVASLDGFVYFYDVYDRDTECRGVGCARVTARSGDEYVVIARHRPRLGGLNENGPALGADPSWDTDGRGTVSLQADGTGGAASELVPTLEAVTCAAPLSRAFPDVTEGEDARVCLVLDPFAAKADTITLSYGGRIPFTTTSGANFEAGSNLVETRGDPCREGVIGSEQVPADGPLAGYPGDRLVITGDLPPSILESEDVPLRRRCEQLVERTVSGATTPISLPILRALSMPMDGRDTYAGRLVLADPAGSTLDQVIECYPELAQVEVRASDAFVVESRRSGFLHPIVRGADGECTVDPDRLAQGLRGRARFDQTFENEFITFALGERPPLLSAPTLTFTVAEIPLPSRVDVSSIGTSSSASSLLSRIVYNEVDERLYVVDQARVGLVRIRMTNLSAQSSFR